MNPNPWSNAEEHAERAREYFQAGQWEKALTELQAALAVNPDQSEWHQGMGMTLDALERYDQAILSYQQVLRLRGQEIPTLLHLAVDLMRTDRPTEAIAQLEKVNRIDPDCESGYCYRIAAYAQLGDHEQAEVMFYLARQVQEQCPLCYDHLAHSLWKQALQAEQQAASASHDAKREKAQGSAQDQSSGEIAGEKERGERGEGGGGGIDKAIWCWKQALELEPNFPQAHVWLARANWKKGHLAQAQQHYLNHLRQEPGDASAIYELGTLLMEAGQTAQAAEKFRRILELEPKSAQAHLRLAVIAIRQHHLDTADSELDRAQEDDPSIPGLHLRRAEVALLRGQRPQALREAMQELDRGEHSPDRLLDLIRCLLDLQQPKPVLELLKRAMSDRHRFVLSGATSEYRASLHLYQGVAWMLLGRADKAVDDFRRTVRLSPDNVVAMHNLVLAYAQRQRYARAGYWLSRALAIQPQDRELRRLKRRLVMADWGYRWSRFRQSLVNRLMGKRRR